MSLNDGQLHNLVEVLLEQLDTGLVWEYKTEDQYSLSLETGTITLTRKIEERKTGTSILTSFKLVLIDKKENTLGTLNESDESGDNNLFTLFQQIKKKKDKDLIAFNAIMDELVQGD